MNKVINILLAQTYLYHIALNKSVRTLNIFTLTCGEDKLQLSAESTRRGTHTPGIHLSRDILPLSLQ